MYKLFEKIIDLKDGREISIETGKLAKQADGSVVVKMGKTMLLATVVSAKESNPEVDFMPLSVEYQEKFSAIGRFPGGFMKREGRPGENEILVSRIVDRALRPLFPKDYHAETFVTVQLISGDVNVPPDALAGLAASSALTLSDIPFDGPMSEVRVVRLNGEFLLNPTIEEIENADLDLIVGATIENILMVEGEMAEVSEKEMVEALKFAHEAIKEQCQAQLELAEKVGVKQTREYAAENTDEELKADIFKNTYDKVYTVAKSALPKQERKEAFEEILTAYKEALPELEDTEDEKVRDSLCNMYFHDVERDAVRNLILDEGIRLDGRKTDEIRPIWCEVDYLPSAHGSAIFTRGETQSLTTVTLGSKLDEKIVDNVLEQGKDKFLLHYNFPPFSTGDARPSRGTSRREIGHGNLAHRALKKQIPTEEENNPYAIRLVSDILESNGSSSMATVCAGTLALMDSGIKIKKPVSGIAMGLITDSESGKYAVLSDILGDEDHLGDMDFKVTGTADGITATQMDIKVKGLSYEILAKALEQAHAGRLHILNKMLETMPETREDYKPHAPRMLSMSIPKDMIGSVIGPGGKIIQEIQSKSDTIIVIEEADGKGVITISGTNKEAIDKGITMINAIVIGPEENQIYKGKVVSTTNFGAFVEILPGKEGLLHISEIDWKRINKVEDVLNVGDEVEVKLIEIDKRTGKLRLSRKALMKRPPRRH